ncbi:MAG: CoA-transferase [Chloroflexota bacterium]
MEVIESGIGELIQPPDLEAFRAWNRENKPRTLLDKRMTEKEAISRFVKDGDYIGTELYGTVRCPMSLVRELIRQGKRRFSVAGQGVLELDMMLAAGMVDKLDITYIGMELYGVSHGLRRTVEGRQLAAVTDWSNAGITWRFKATSIGAPFLPVSAMLGTDTFRYSAAKTAKCPFTGKTVCLVPALVLDVGLIHVHRADKYGNCQIEGISGFAFEMSRACKRLIISADEIVPTEEIRKYPDRTMIPFYLVDAVVLAPFGSHPGELAYVHNRDEPVIKEWIEANKTPEGAQEYLDKYVYRVKDHKEYLELIGEDRLNELRTRREV